MGGIGVLIVWLLCFTTTLLGIGNLIDNFETFRGIGASPALRTIALGCIGMLLAYPPTADAIQSLRNTMK